MDGRDRCHRFLFLLAMVLLSHVFDAQGQGEPLVLSYNSTVQSPRTWDWSHLSAWEFHLPSPHRHFKFFPILLTNTTDPDLYFACGFLESFVSGKTFVLGVIAITNDALGRVTEEEGLAMPPVLLWSANRNSPVKDDAMLELNGDGGLVLLRDAKGKSVVWSTNTTGAMGLPAAGMNLTRDGNLVLYGSNDKILWQSFDHPTDTFHCGMSFVGGRRLTANKSSSSWSEGQYFLSFTGCSLIDGLCEFEAFYDAVPPQRYNIYKGRALECPDTNASSFVFSTLGYGGRLESYTLETNAVLEPSRVFSPNLDDCDYPMVCGVYGLCRKGHCICPQGDDESEKHFELVDSWDSRQGCRAVTSLSCQASASHKMTTLQDVSFFNHQSEGARSLKGISADGCMKACLENCSCVVAMHLNNETGVGNCYLQLQIFSLRVGLGNWNHNSSLVLKSTTTYLKVQLPDPSPSRKPSTTKIVGSIIGATLGVLLVLAIVVVLVRKRRENQKREDGDGDGDGDDDLDYLPGLPTKFCYEELRVATEDFHQKLGEGGFGSVFKGTLVDDRRVAVKRLESVTQGKREFLAEVETIGSIHHLNLVTLIGFCADKSYRLLVYEYMSNGSLDKWIFQKAMNSGISWQVRKRIINQVARGLRYLHEECIHKIVHLDIKPQNILLDENLNAKLSDFGLSKLIDRDKSSVMTMMRGTPGYLAPEWLTSTITEKVDVYSFGVVLAEIVCGRKNLDHSESNENILLLNELKVKVTQDRLFEIVNKYCIDTEFEEDEAIKLLRLAIWCLQSNYNERPSMSIIVKVLEGAMDVDRNLGLDILTLPNNAMSSSSTTDSASVVPPAITRPR